MSQQGSVRQRGLTFTAYWRADGEKAGQRTKGGFVDEDAAWRYLRSILGQIDNGVYVDPAQVRLGPWLRDKWLPTVVPVSGGAMVKGHTKASTYVSYRHYVDDYVAPQLGAIKLQQLTTARINRFYIDLLTTGRVKTGRGLSAATVHRIAVVLRRALGDAVKHNLLARNPADNADVPSARQGPELVTWDADQMRAFLRSVADDRLRPLWVLAASTGMRRGELLGARWPDLDLEAGQLHIRQTLLSVGYKLAFDTPKTAKGRRTVALDGFTVASLKAWKAAQAAERLAWGPAWNDNGLIFTKEDGSPIHPDSLTKTFARRVRDAGLPMIRLHDLRHSFISVALEGGEDVKVISTWVGHSTIAFTLDRYRHVLPGEQEAAAERVAGRLFGGA